MGKDNKVIGIVLGIFVGVIGLCCLSSLVLVMIRSAEDNTEKVAQNGSDEQGNQVHYLKYDDIDPMAVDLYVEADKLDSEGNFKEALAKIDEALEISPDSMAMEDFKCYVLIHLGEYDTALLSCLKVESEYPNSAFTLSKLSQINWEIEDCDKTNEYASRLANLEGIEQDDQRILYGNAGVFLADCGGDSDTAIRMLENALSKTIDTELTETYQSYLNELKSNNENPQ